MTGLFQPAIWAWMSWNEFSPRRLTVCPLGASTPNGATWLPSLANGVIM